MVNKIKLQNIFLAIIEWSILAAVFFTPIYFAFFQENFSVFDLNKSAWLRLCLFTAISAWLLFISLSNKIPYSKSRIVFWSWLTLFVVFIISTIFSIHPMISFLGTYERHQGLYNIAAYLLIFVFIVTFFHNKKQLNKLLIAINLSASIICLYGLIQALGLDFLYWSETSFSRIFSTFGQPNFFGHYLVVVIPLTTYAIFFIGKKFLSRIWLIILLLSELACLFFTLSRGAWVAMAVSLFITLLYFLFKFKKNFLALTIIALSLVVVTVILSPNIRLKITNSQLAQNNKIISRLTSIVDFESGSSAVRFKYLKASWEIFSEASLYRKLFGFGPDILADVFVSKYQPDWGYYERLNSFPDRAHNNFFDNILQFGLVGWFSLLFLVFICLKSLVKKLRGVLNDNYWLAVALGFSLLAYTINNFFSFSLTAMSLMFFVVLGMAWRLGQPTENIEYHSIYFFHKLSLWLMSLCIIAFFGMLFFSHDVRPLVADHYYIEVERDKVQKDCYSALNNMENVMAWYPLSHFYARSYLAHATNCYPSATSENAKTKILNNIKEQIDNISDKESQFYSLINISHAYSILGYYSDPKYYDIAETYYKKMLILGPNITTTYQDYGRMKMWQGKQDEARKIYFQGIAVTPPLEKAFPESEHTAGIAKQLSYFYYLIGLTYRYQNSFNEAINSFEKTIKIYPQTTSAYKELADIFYKQGNINKAIYYNKEAIAVEPTEPLWATSLASLYLQSGDKVTALRYALEADKLAPGDPGIKKILDKLK